MDEQWTDLVEAAVKAMKDVGEEFKKNPEAALSASATTI
jgi:hypothetical protein